MNFNKTGGSILLLIAVTVVGYFAVTAFFPPTDHVDYSLSNGKKQKAQLPSQDLDKTENHTMSANSEVEAKNGFMTKALAEELSWVATAYAQQARYPHYSTPIVDAELARTPTPFEEARVVMTTFEENGNLSPITIAASVDKLRYVVGEPITFQIQLSGIDSDASVFVDARIKPTDSRALLSENIDLVAINNKQTEFRATIDSASLELDRASQELLAIVDIEINGAQYTNTVPFVLGTSSALLQGVGESKQQQDFLEITLDYKVEQAGYYFVRAYLDDANTNRPLLALQSEGSMSKGHSQLVLKAHQHALKDSGSQGPYTLRIARSFRGAEPGEGDDVPTALSQTSYPIADFSFDGYADIPFSDPAVNARLQVLKELSGNE